METRNHSKNGAVLKSQMSRGLKNKNMKTKTILIITASIGIMITLNACKAKKIEKTTGGQEVIVPFSENKYKSDKDFFRAHQSGNSLDLATAKKIALQNAKADLAGNIKSLVKKVTDQYTNQRTVKNKQDDKVNEKQDYENKFEELAREVVDQTLTDVRIMDEKIFKEKDGGYTYWVAVEESKQSIVDGVSNKISKDEKLQLDYDKKKFEDVFNKEMEKMAKEQ